MSNAAIAAPNIIPDFKALGIFSIIILPRPVSPKNKISKVNSIHIAAMYLKLSPSPYSPDAKPFEPKKIITSGRAGVTHPAAIGSPKIIGLEVIKKLAIKHTATACIKSKPSA